MTSRRLSAGIYARRFGSGPELVMLHGWAMHGGIWLEFASRLAERYTVTVLDLPGHGLSAPLGDYSLACITDMLLDAAPRRAHWLGWSLGGLLAAHVAGSHTDRVDGLVLLAGTPRFTAAAGWPGVNPALLREMAQNLQDDFSGTLARFIGLQCHGQTDARSLARRIQSSLDGCEPPEPAALSGGLTLLENEDLRGSLQHFHKPVLAILGGRDRLVPGRELLRPLQEIDGCLEVHQLEAAAHLPFLTHPAETLALIFEYLDRWTRDQACA